MNSNKGFSIVELMVAMLLGLLLMGGVVQVLTGSQASYNDLVQQSRMQETAKIALDYIVRDMRNVGYWGCNGAAMQVANSLDSSFSGYFDLSDTLNGWSAEDTNLPTAFSSALPNSDVVEMRIMDINGALTVAGHNPQSAKIELNTTHTFKSGTVWAVVDRDCSNIGVFAQSGPTNNNGTASHIVHNTGIGNCTKDLKGNFNCGNHETNSVTEAYSQGSSVFSVQRIAYAIAPSGSNANINSLHRITLDINNDGEELIDGVDGLRFRFGLDTDSDGSADLFADADTINGSASYAFNQVISVAIDIDVSTYDEAGFQSQTFTTSVRLRNRGLS